MPTDEIPHGSLLEAAFERMQTEFINESYDECLDCAIVVYLLSKNINFPKYNSTAKHFIKECSQHIAATATDSSIQANPAPYKCSFCSKSPPEVRLGAGPSVFICNECVQVFAVALS
jgi:hypothetical protein